jgi:hypothetical protein
VIYVVDSSDSERLNISKDELMAMLNVRSTLCCAAFRVVSRRVPLVARDVPCDES